MCVGVCVCVTGESNATRITRREAEDAAHWGEIQDYTPDDGYLLVVFTLLCRAHTHTHTHTHLISIKLNSVYFVQPNITNYKFASEGFTICTHSTSLTFDLTSDQEKLPRNRKNPFTGKSEETLRRATEEDPSPGLTDGQMSCDQKESLQSYYTLNSQFDLVSTQLFSLWTNLIVCWIYELHTGVLHFKVTQSNK